MHDDGGELVINRFEAVTKAGVRMSQPLKTIQIPGAPPNSYSNT